MSTTAVLKLQKAGFTNEQVEAQGDFMDTQAASKTDLKDVEYRLEQKIDAVKAELAEVRSDVRLLDSSLRGEMRQIEQRMTIKLGGMLVVITGVLLAAMRYFSAGH